MTSDKLTAKYQKRIDGLLRRLEEANKENERLRLENENIKMTNELLFEKYEEFENDYSQLLADICEVKAIKSKYEQTVRDTLKIKKEYEAKMRKLLNPIK